MAVVLSNVSCGGINLNNSAFATSNNIITTVGTTASASHTTTPCGVLFDSNVFTVKKNTEGANVLTSVNSVETNSTTAAVTGYTYSPTAALTTEDTTITITYQGKTTTQAITVTA